MPSFRFVQFFQKFQQLCRDRSHERKVFGRKLDLARSKGDSLRGGEMLLLVQSSERLLLRGYSANTCEHNSSP
jgi:hypothetical protein